MQGHQHLLEACSARTGTCKQSSKKQQAEKHHEAVTPSERARSIASWSNAMAFRARTWGNGACPGKLARIMGEAICAIVNPASWSLDTVACAVWGFGGRLAAAASCRTALCRVCCGGIQLSMFCIKLPPCPMQDAMTRMRHKACACVTCLRANVVSLVLVMPSEYQGFRPP